MQQRLCGFYIKTSRLDTGSSTADSLTAQLMEQIVTDDLNATLRRWLELYNQATPSESLPDWSEVMLSMQQQGWQSLPDQQAELLAIMTQESIEFTRFAAELMNQQDDAALIRFLTDFHQHINHLSDDWILKRWFLPEQLVGLLKTRIWNPEQLEAPWQQLTQHLLNLPGMAFCQQGALRKLQQLTREHFLAVQDYTQHFSQINTQAIHDLSCNIEAAPERASSLKQLHRWWIDAYEGCYRTKMANQDYQLAHGRVSNTFLALKLWLQEQRNLYLTQLGIASETSLNLAFEKIHQLSKQLRKLEQLPQQTAQLANELADLKQQLFNTQDDR